MTGILAAACNGGGTAPTSTPSAVPTATPHMPAGSVTPKPTFTPSPGSRQIAGLFFDERPSPPGEYRAVGPKPPESFSMWNGSDVVLYDIEAMTETNLGRGFQPGFTRDGKYLYWTNWEHSSVDPASTGELFVLELATGERRALGPARYAISVDSEHLGVLVRNGEFALISIADGQRIPMAMPPLVPLSPPAAINGYLLESVYQDGWAYGFGAYRVTDVSGRLIPLEFEVWQVALTADGVLVIATSPYDLRPQGGVVPGKVATSNIFEVDSNTGIATWIASASASEVLFPFAADERYIAWTEDLCNMTGTPPLSNGHTRIYDRQTKTLTELDRGFFIAGITPRGELAVGAFGADALIDLETLRYTAVFPQQDRVWSPDYRYAAVGMTGGHGGFCGGE